jgi:CheY-like chemotaxis protein
MLDDAEFIVVEAANADEAMRILELRNDIRAVFTDINMPGTLDGIRLAQLVRGRWPPIYLILTSGLMIPNKGDFPADGRFIRKPYDPKCVIATIRELLGQAPPSDPHARKAA